MAEALIWITGGSSGIGRAMVETVPFSSATVINISRSPCPGVVNLSLDLSDPLSWGKVACSFEREMLSHDGSTVILVHAAATVQPVCFAEDAEHLEAVRSVLLNSAVPQVLGSAFLSATRGRPNLKRVAIFLSSGAASHPYEGWSFYGAGKASIEQWVRTTGAEQRMRGGALLLAVAPGVVDTPMQQAARSAKAENFPQRERFVELHATGQLTDPNSVARRIWSLLYVNYPSGSILDLRRL